MAEDQFTTEELFSEVWRDIPDFDGKYQVSNLGRVRSVIVRVLKPCPAQNPEYARVSLYKNRQAVVGTIHQLVALAFIGPVPNGMLVNHKDTRKRNNRASNLEYRTPKGNAEHASECGLMPRGEANGGSKLTENEAHRILQLLFDGHSQYRVAEHFGVSQRTVHLLAQRRAWKHLARPLNSTESRCPRPKRGPCLCRF